MTDNFAKKALWTLSFMAESAIASKVRDVPVAGSVMRARMEDRVWNDDNVAGSVRSREARRLMADDMREMIRRLR